MTDDDDESNGEEPNSRTGGSRYLGARLEMGLRTIADVLGSLVETEVRNAPLSERTVEWEDVVDADIGAYEETGSGREEPPLRKATADRCLADARFEDGRFVVTVDIPGAEADDVSVGIDPGTDQLVVGENDTVVARIDLPWSAALATDVWFNNGVLEVRLRPADA